VLKWTTRWDILNITIDLCRDRINSVVIENSSLFEEFILDLRHQIDKKGENFLALVNNSTLELSRSAVLICSPFDITYDKKDLQKKLISSIAADLRSSELSDELTEILERLVGLLEKLSLVSDFEIAFSVLDDMQLLKAVETFLPAPKGTFAEKIISFSETVHKLTGKTVFILANCDAYISDDDYTELCKYFQYAGLELIFIRNRQRNLNGNENEYIIDNDLCELH